MASSVSLACICCGSPQEIFIDRIWDDRYGCPGVFSIRRCGRCGQMATMPPLSESDLPGLYSRYYPRRSIDFASMEREAAQVSNPGAARRRWWAGTDNQGHYRAQRGQKVLDIGSGSCLSLLEMKNMGVDASGVEADPNVGAIAERYGLRVHIGSVHDNPFPGETFDLITLNQVIEHVPDPARMLSALHDRIRPNGRLVLSFPNTGSWQRRISGSRWINWHVPYHQHHFNLRSFERMAQAEGYIVVSARTVTPNVWTVLQLRAMGESPAEGQASGSWATTARSGAAPSVAQRIRGGVMRRARVGVSWGLAVVNRVLDKAGWGDSLIVELQVAGGEPGTED